MYKPGSHILVEVRVNNVQLLRDHHAFKKLIDQLIGDLNLSKIGEIYHPFDEAGFTGVVCLTESHLSIHTWPEFNTLTFDVFLSNFMRDNTAATHSIADQVIDYFKGEIINKQEVKR